MWVFYLYLLAALCVCSAVGNDDVILKPVKSTGKQASLVILHGAMINASSYIPVAQQIQQNSELQLWVGIPTYISNQHSADEAIKRVVNEMQEQGMDTDTYFTGGHSLGTVFSQAYCYSNPSGCNGGVILFAGNLLRNSSDNYFYQKGYPVPVLTVGGELDGLTRITRMMEGYYHQVLNAQSPQAAISYPIVVLEGVTHMTFASGTPPPLVYEKDLKPEVTYDQAHQMMGEVSASWIDYRVLGAPALVLDSYMLSSADLLAPLVNAFRMESYYYFEIPCYLKYPDAVDGDSCCRQGGGCQCGNRWSPISQTFMGGLEAINLVDEDVMHPVSQVPVHIPHVNNTCDHPDSTCTLLTNTVTENIYDSHIESDNPIYPLAAQEMRTKLKCRQAIQQAAGVQNVDFNTTDGPSRCAELNNYNFDWAINTARVHSSLRYKKYGEKLVYGADNVVSSGYFWVTTDMTYTSTVVDGEQVIMVNSTALATPTTYREKDAAGMHYCKVLSPAHAMEWIYVDGLRLRYSLSSSG